jgi:hypothetical protein
MIPSQAFPTMFTQQPHPSQFFNYQSMKSLLNNPISPFLSYFQPVPAVPVFLYPNNQNFCYYPKFLDNTPLEMTQNYQNCLPMLPTPNILKTEVDSFSIKSPKSEAESEDEAPNKIISSQPQFLLELPNDDEILLEAQIKYIVQFFINNFGIASDKDIQKTRAQYLHDKKLTAVFDALEKKYTAGGKTREEMIKWIVRKIFKSSKDNIKGKNKKSQRKLLEDVCNKYFKGPKISDSFVKKEGKGSQNDDDNDDAVDFLLPFRKNSKNKTMNNNFVNELFQSEAFKRDYQIFLKQFDKTAEEDNTEKIRRFVRVVVECSKKGCFKSVMKYRRVPWLKSWQNKTKSVALELDEGYWRKTP